LQRPTALWALGNKQAARHTLETICLMRDLESLYRIHAWNLLRKAGGSPPTSVNSDVLVDCPNDLYSDHAMRLVGSA
jgi:hypothetical protein